MTIAHPSSSRIRGFTLLELLIAVTAFSIVLAAINTVFYGALRLRNRTAQALEEALPAQQALAILKRDLANLVMPGGNLTGALQTTPTNTTSMGFANMGQPVSPEFHTATGLIDQTSPWAEIQKVAYHLMDPTNHMAGRDLVRSVTRNLLPLNEEPPVRQWLLRGVQAASFSYFDGTQWREYWDSAAEEAVLPKAIRVQIEFATEAPPSMPRPPAELVVPVVIEARTNQTAQAEGGGR